MIFKYITPQQNFLARPVSDGSGWEVNSDLVATVDDRGNRYRLVLAGGSYHMRRLARPSKARASALRRRIYAMPCRLKTRDDVYLAALHADGYPHTRRLRLALRLRGYLTRLWRY